MCDSKKLREILDSYEAGDVVIHSHADHDGQASSLALNHLFGDMETIFSQSSRPKRFPRVPGKDLFVVCDLRYSEKQINLLLKKGFEVINLDHHGVMELEDDNYHCFNPKLIYGEELISTSGLIWKLFSPEEIDWILAMGSAGDLAVEGVPGLFEKVKSGHPELIEGTDLRSIYGSKIYELARMIQTSFNEPKRGFKLLKKSLDEGHVVLYESQLHEDYLKKRRDIDRFINSLDKDKGEEEFLLIDSSDENYSGSYVNWLNLDRSDGRIYIEYNEGRLYFRNFFGDKDIRDLAELFGGGGAHIRAGGAYANRSFEAVEKQIKDHFNFEQTSLDKF